MTLQKLSLSWHGIRYQSAAPGDKLYQFVYFTAYGSQAKAPISSGHPCTDAFDGILTGSSNGWAHSGNTPAWHELTLLYSSSVSGVTIWSGVDRADTHVNDFALEVRIGG